MIPLPNAMNKRFDKQYEEIEDLKFRYAKAQEQLEAYARQYGPIG